MSCLQLGSSIELVSIGAQLCTSVFLYVQRVVSMSVQHFWYFKNIIEHVGMANMRNIHQKLMWWNLCPQLIILLGYDED